LNKRRLERANRALVERAEREGGFLVGESPAMRALADTAARAAESNVTVLITGESGTGKQVLSEFIHRSSGRSGGPFVYINCVALSDELIESTLFGHEKGAFTGALSQKPGRVEAAAGGTAFLDEIGDVSAKLQAKLLHFLETGEFERVGGSRTLSVDCRVIAATNRDLRQAIRDGDFREDLFYRLNVITLDVPPLRERPGDLEPLVASILERKAREHGLASPDVPPATWRALRSHPWSGNVRELENSLERALLLCSGGTLDVSGLGLEPPATDASGVLPGTRLRDAERELILATLRATDGNRTRASEMLGISVRTMRNKLREYREAGYLKEEDA